MGGVNSRRRKRDKKGHKLHCQISPSPTSHSFDLDLHHQEELQLLRALYGSHLSMERSRDDAELNCYPVPPEGMFPSLDVYKSTMSLNRNFSHRVTMATAGAALREGASRPDTLLCQRGADSNTTLSVGSKASSKGESTTTPLTTSKDALRQRLNLENHPAMTRLQNEQNSRLENMEQRMNKIRQSAQQELERRKFAHLFKARTDESSHTEKLLQEASEALQLFKKQKQLKKSKEKVSSATDNLSAETSLLYGGVMRGDSQDKEESDSGEIIPVRIVPDKSAVREKNANQKAATVPEKERLSWVLQPLDAFNISGPMMWLLLPFLLPVLLVLHLIRHICHHGDQHVRKKN
ncbi:hypothetical protein BaRGS_00032213 [Batillaria attramentaria]|uniref:Uncharacterized protein n=1 Tax=Batillaria attramentaria TaxID=370345 RepID=A0ABD0JPE2_9CAEN